MPRTAVKDFENVAVIETDTGYEPKPVSTYIDEPLHGVKFIQRDIAAGFPAPQGAWEAAAVDAYLSSYLNQGWTLHSAQCVGRRQEGVGTEQTVPVFSMVYVLVK